MLRFTYKESIENEIVVNLIKIWIASTHHSKVKIAEFYSHVRKIKRLPQVLYAWYYGKL